MEGAKEKKRVTITGTVVPTDWGKDGKVVTVALSTPAEDEYVITDNSIGQELLQLVGAKIVATGMLTSDENWNRRITLDTYETLEEDEEDEEDEYLDEEEYHGEQEPDEDQLFEAEEEW